ncbi:MAG: DUF2723 domain-containing protein [Candidatus Aminicenantales bacterium]
MQKPKTRVLDLVFALTFALCATAIFSEFSFLQFPRKTFLFKGDPRHKIVEVRKDFDWDKTGEDGQAVLELDLGHKVESQRTLLCTINGRPSFLVTSPKKGCLVTFPYSFLHQGNNQLSILSQREWTLRRLRIKNVYGYSKGFLSIVLALKNNRYGGLRTIKDSPLNPAWAGLFFLLTLAGAGTAGLGRLALLRRSRWLESLRWLLLGLIVLPLPVYFLSDLKIYIETQFLAFLVLAGVAISWVPVARHFRGQLKEKLLTLFRVFNRHKARNLTVILVLTASVLYTATLLPGMAGTGDTAKFQFIGKVLGVPHSPGYPLYVMLNSLFIRIPVGSVAYRANLMSAFFAVLALVLFFHLARSISKHETAAFYAALFLAFSQTFWSQAVIAEVYTLNIFFLALVLFLLAKWQDRRKDFYLYLFFLSYALSFGNHLTMITVFPALLVFILTVEAKALWKPKTIGLALGSVLLGMGQYAFLWIRGRQGAPYLEQDVSTLKALINVVTAQRFQDQMFTFSFKQVLSDRIPLFLRNLIEECSLYLVVIGIVGLVYVFLKNKKVFFLIFLALAGEAFYVLNLDIPDLICFFIPIFLLFAVLISLGVAWMFQALGRKPYLRAAGHILILVFLVSLAVSNFPKADRSHDRDSDEMLNALFENIPPYSLIINPDDYNSIQYVFYKMLVDFENKHIIQIIHYPGKNLLQEFYIQSYWKIKRDRRLWGYFLAAATSRPATFPPFENFLRDEPAMNKLMSNVYVISENLAKEILSMECSVREMALSSKHNEKQYKFFKVHF